MTIRIQRLESLIRHRVATVLLRDMHDPRIGMVTVTKVKLAKDLSTCRVYWSTLEEGARRRTVTRALDDARGFVQREIAAVLETRKVPVLAFEFDPSIEGADRIYRLLKEVVPEQTEGAPEPVAEDPPGGDGADR